MAKPQSKVESRGRKAHSYTSKNHPPPAFWDRLSKIWLTKSALRELDRRNSQANIRTTYHQLHVRTASDFLRNCGTRSLRDLRLSARRGGPDLSDLKWVRFSKSTFQDLVASLTSVHPSIEILLPILCLPRTLPRRHLWPTAKRQRLGLIRLIFNKP